MTYEVVVVREDAEWHVWLDDGTGDDAPGGNSIIVGTGPSRESALREARLELERALVVVMKALQCTREVLR